MDEAQMRSGRDRIVRGNERGRKPGRRGTLDGGSLRMEEVRGRENCKQALKRVKDNRRECWRGRDGRPAVARVVFRFLNFGRWFVFFPEEGEEGGGVWH
jgi:hypothetical protein